ncbi:MAG: lipid-A-disaccharide synthase [Lacunisphaera sp.]|nr:lipid-A-disaccharide synthase [Lacunisphaera sp.]
MSKVVAPKSLPAPAAGPVDLLIVAGEHSGDEHAARVVRELLVKNPNLKICALGGPELAKAGALLLHDLTATSVVGFVEVLKHYSYFKALFDATLRWVASHQPRAVCFVDYPGFNLRLAAQLRARGLSVQGGGKVKLLYYISPQIWAWKPRRRFSMARDLDAMAVIFPFEPDCYADTKLPVEFVGHPFLAPDYSAPVRHDPAGPVLLLPGSRTQAVAKIFPLLLAGFAEFRKADPDARAVVLYPSEEVLAAARKVLAQWPPLAAAVELRANAGSTAASAVLTSSGTMSLHCALAGIPGAVVYKTKTLTYWLGRMLVSVEFIGMANLLLKEPMYPEFIQGAATARALARQLRECTADELRRERTRAQAVKLRALLAQPVVGTAADWLVRQL